MKPRRTLEQYSNELTKALWAYLRRWEEENGLKDDNRWKGDSTDAEFAAIITDLLSLSDLLPTPDDPTFDASLARALNGCHSNMILKLTFDEIKQTATFAYMAAISNNGHQQNEPK